MSSLLQESPTKTKHNYGTVSSYLDTETTPDNASFFSRMLFSYANPLMKTGNQRQLNLEDLWDLSGANTTQEAYTTYKKQYDACQQSVIQAMWYTYGFSFILCGVAMLFSMGCSVFAPAVLHHVIDSFTAETIDIENLFLWLVAFFTSKLLNAFVTAQMSFYLELVALRLTVAMKNLLFEKAMRRSIQSKGDLKSIDIANLYTSDVSNVLWAAFQINNLWILPIQITIVIYMLYNVIDMAAFAGLSVIGISMAMSLLIAKYSGQAFEDIMERKDTRMKTIKEVFGAIQIVKLNAWETKFADKIKQLRAHELSAVSQFMYLGALSIFTLWASPLFVSMTSFGVYAIVMGKTLTAAKVFTAMALFNAIRDPLRDLPTVISQCIQAKVSLDRMQDFLSIQEYDPSNVSHESKDYPPDLAVVIENGSFGWSPDSPLLQDVNIQVHKGDFVVIHGSVGAGKSTLCSAILGETDKIDGSVFVRGNVAYYSQQTWIQNMTIRENILFGNPYDEKRYVQVLDACGLLSDLDQFPARDATEIGQKGINLSGGQKARLCLARACYANADVLILDSPLAAVDAVVQNEIFMKCLCHFLHDKTILLVTHAPDIIASKATNYKIEIIDGMVDGERYDPIQSRQSYGTKVREQPLAPISVPVNGRLVDEEEREEGRVSSHVFSSYFNAMGGVSICVFLFLIQTLWQAFQIGSDFWLSHWTGQKQLAVDANTSYNMKIYALLGGCSALMVLIRSMTVAYVGIRAARYLFDTMTRSLLHAPLRFFDANPIGRIVNRYGDDMAAVDFQLPFAFGGFLATLFFTVCQLATAIYTVNFLGILVLPLVYMYLQIAQFYLAPSREISRLWKVSSSPVLSHVTGSEEGVALIRAFGSDYVDRAIAENFKRIDVNNKVWFAETVTSQWFQVRMQLLGCGVVMLVVSALVYLRAYLSPGIVGLAFTYALSVDGGLATLVRVWSWVEICMVSPERIMEYSTIPVEGEGKILVIEPSSEWPRQGTIQFDNVVFSYKPGTPPVLKGLSFEIRNNEKIGIVGRTGAGKSSLTMALFRINELDAGRILIDKQDISTMPLQSLRSRLSIIPQAPVLFKGTLRAYMDPFDEYSDADIWNAFEKVEMKEQIRALDGQLLYELSENGENFSVGERQMLCMSRAMLNKSRVVIMDEATASIDHATEKKLQNMINRDFKNATVLTIAHRLATVLDSDRIMVLRNGQVLEFDTPKNLIQNPKGLFYELAKEGGYLDQLIMK